MNKHTASSLIFLTGIFFYAATLHAELPAVNQEDDIKQKYHEAVTAKHQTLEAPLLSAPSWNDRLKSMDFSTGGPSYKIEHTKNLSLQTLGRRVLRLQYGNTGKPAMLTWEFEKPMDVRGQWFQLDCMGPTPPGHFWLNIKSKAGAPDSRFDLYLDNSPEPQRILFKLPAGENFSEVLALSLIFDSKEPEKNGRDFAILNFAPMPKGTDPLADLPASDPSRFDGPLATAIL